MFFNPGVVVKDSARFSLYGKVTEPLAVASGTRTLAGVFVAKSVTQRNVKVATEPRSGGFPKGSRPAVLRLGNAGAES